MRERLSHAAIVVLHALARGETHGFDIIERTGLRSSSVYPTLGKLEDAGFVDSWWENPAKARQDKRPPRRYYGLRAAGRRALEQGLERYRALQRMPAASRLKGRRA